MPCSARPPYSPFSPFSPYQFAEPPALAPYHVFRLRRMRPMRQMGLIGCKGQPHHTGACGGASCATASAIYGPDGQDGQDGRLRGKRTHDARGLVYHFSGDLVSCHVVRALHAMARSSSAEAVEDIDHRISRLRDLVLPVRFPRYCSIPGTLSIHSASAEPEESCFFPKAVGKTFSDSVNYFSNQNKEKSNDRSSCAVP